MDALNNKAFGPPIKSGRYEDAITCSDLALKIKSNDISSLHYKAVACDLSGSYQKAMDCYDKIIRIDPLNVQAWKNKGIVLARLKKK